MIAIENDESRHVDLWFPPTDPWFDTRTQQQKKQKQNFNQFFGGCGIRHRERDSTAICFVFLFEKKKMFFFLSKKSETS